MWYLYILLCKDGSFYTGITNNLEKRLSEHKNGTGGRYTRSHKPIKFIHKEDFLNKLEALKREFEIKSWSRDKKIRLIYKNYLIPSLKEKNLLDETIR